MGGMYKVELIIYDKEWKTVAKLTDSDEDLYEAKKRVCEQAKTAVPQTYEGAELCACMVVTENGKYVEGDEADATVKNGRLEIEV